MYALVCGRTCMNVAVCVRIVYIHVSLCVLCIQYSYCFCSSSFAFLVRVFLLWGTFRVHTPSPSSPCSPDSPLPPPEPSSGCDSSWVGSVRQPMLLERWERKEPSAKMENSCVVTPFLDPSFLGPVVLHLLILEPPRFLF